MKEKGVKINTDSLHQRATKLVQELREVPYEDRLSRLGLTTLEDRRTRGDMIEVFKNLRGYENINPNQFYQLAPRRHQIAIRGHSFKLQKPHHRTAKRSNFFNARVVNKWNRLSENVVASTSVNAFKKRYNYFKEPLRRGNPMSTAH